MLNRYRGAWSREWLNAFPAVETESHHQGWRICPVNTVYGWRQFASVAFFSQGSILRLCDLVDKVIREEIAQFSTMLSMSLPTTSYIKRPLCGAALRRMCWHISIRNVLKKCIKLFANWLAQGNSSRVVSSCGSPAINSLLTSRQLGHYGCQGEVWRALSKNP